MTEAQWVRPRIVVGVDGSESAKHALRWAQRLADGEGASLDVIGAWLPLNSYGVAALPMEYSPKDDLEKALTDTVDEVFGAHRPAGLQVRAVQGGAAHVLIDASADALMVVVGSRGRGGFRGLLLGSVSASVAEHATCPVLVVHETREKTS